MSILSDPEVLANVPSPSGVQQSLYLDSVTGLWSSKVVGGTATALGGLTLGAVGSTPNANGATFTPGSTNTLTLEPSSTSYPGVMTATQATKLAALPSNWYDVTAYGVTTGNSGSTNNTNLATLLSNAPSSSVIYFPGGFFPFASQITIPAKIFYFVGSGSGLSGTQSAFYWTSNVANDLIVLTAGNWFTQFRDISFITSVAQTAGSVVNVNGNACINFVNCVFTGLSSSNTLFNCINFNGANGAEITSLSNCQFTNFTGTAIIVNCNLSTLTIDDITINGGAIAACGINIIVGGAIQIVNSDVISCTNNLLINPVVSTVVASVWCDQTYFDSSGGSCIKITGAGATVRCKFDQCSFTVSATASPANAFEYSSTYTSSLGCGLDIVDCNVLNTFGSTGVGTGFNITGAPDFRIDGCNIAGWATGISITPAALAGMTKALIINNTIGTSGGYAGNTTGINLLVGSYAYGSILIDNNTMIGNTTNIIDASGIGTGTSMTGFKSINSNTGLITPMVTNYTATAIPLTTVTNVDSRGGLFIPIGAGNGSGSFRGATVRITIRATNSASAQTLTATVRYGTNNSNADSAIFTQAFTAGTAAVGSGIFEFEIDFLSATTADVAMRFFNGNNAATGIAGVNSFCTALTAPVTIATTANSWLGVYFASTTASIVTVRSVKYEIISQ